MYLRSTTAVRRPALARCHDRSLPPAPLPRTRSSYRSVLICTHPPSGLAAIRSAELRSVVAGHRPFQHRSEAVAATLRASAARAVRSARGYRPWSSGRPCRDDPGVPARASSRSCRCSNRSSRSSSPMHHPRHRRAHVSGTEAAWCCRLLDTSAGHSADRHASSPARRRPSPKPPYGWRLTASRAAALGPSGVTALVSGIAGPHLASS